MQKMSQCLQKVFVYGTLKNGEPNHHWLTKKDNGHCRYVGVGTTAVKFPLVIGTRYNIPFLLAKPGVGHNITGEIYEVDDKMLSNLDVLEDYPNYYDREMQSILTEENNAMNCWVYLIRKYPDTMLSKPFLNVYTNTTQQPYSENYADSQPEDIFEDDC